MTVREDMLNGLGPATAASSTLSPTPRCHAPATATTSARSRITARSIYLRPGKAGERLTATAAERSPAGRVGLYDVKVTDPGGRRRVPRSRPFDRRRASSRRKPATGEETKIVEGTREDNREETWDGVYWDRAKEHDSRAEREAEVLANLQAQLALCLRRAPFYRDHYEKHGFRPEQVETLDDFATRVPIITKPMLRDDQTAHGPFGRYLGCEPSRHHPRTRISGHQRKADALRFIASDWDYSPMSWRRASTPRRAPRRRRATRHGVQPVHGRLGRAARRRTPRGDRFSARRRRDRTSARIDVPHRRDGADHDADLCLHMLETARALGYDTVKSPLRLGIFIGEPGSSIPARAQALEQGWGIKVRDMATTSEMTPGPPTRMRGGPGPACDAGRGLDRDRRQGRFSRVLRMARAARSSTPI